MRTLVTGGGGFLGGAIVERLLALGYDVTVLGRKRRPELEARGVRVLAGDLAELETVRRAAEGCAAVFHVAAKAGVWGSRASYFRPNVLGARNVVAACREEGVRWLVYTSTPSVVFTGASFAGADESLPYGRNWLCHYAQTKAQAERETLAMHEAGRLEVCALRPHLIYGPGDPHLFPRIVAKARAGRLRIVGAGENRVDVTFVANAARAHLDALAALQAGRAGGRAYFVSDGSPVELWPWVNGVLAQLGIEPVHKRVSPRAAYAAGAVAEALWRVLPLKGEPPMTRFVAVELAKSHWYDISAARGELGYSPEVSPDEAIRLTVGWLRANLR